MKFFAVLFASLLFVGLSEQYASFKDCSSADIDESGMYDECLAVTCHASSDGTYTTVLGCPVYACADDKETGYEEEDNSKQYPSCCGGPVCAE